MSLNINHAVNLKLVVQYTGCTVYWLYSILAFFNSVLFAILYVCGAYNLLQIAYCVLVYSVKKASFDH